MPEAEGSFQVHNWEGETYEESEGAVLSRASLTKTFEGDFQGTSTAELLTAEAKDARAYVGMERIDGTMHGIAGTFVVMHTASPGHERPRRHVGHGGPRFRHRRVHRDQRQPEDNRLRGRRPQLPLDLRDLDLRDLAEDFGYPLRRAGDDCLVAHDHDRSLDKDRVFGHRVDQGVAVGGLQAKLLVDGLLRPHHLLRVVDAEKAHHASSTSSRLGASSR